MLMVLLTFRSFLLLWLRLENSLLIRKLSIIAKSELNLNSNLEKNHFIQYFEFANKNSDKHISICLQFSICTLQL